MFGFTTFQDEEMSINSLTGGRAGQGLDLSNPPHGTMGVVRDAPEFKLWLQDGASAGRREP